MLAAAGDSTNRNDFALVALVALVAPVAMFGLLGSRISRRAVPASTTSARSTAAGC